MKRAWPITSSYLLAIIFLPLFFAVTSARERTERRV
jgi:hypothetical protein